MDRLATGVARDEPGLAVDHLWPLAAVAHQPGDFRIRRQCAVRRQLLRGATYLSGAAVLGLAGRVHLLGLAVSHRDHADQPAAGLHHHQGIRRDRVHRRGVDDCGLGRLRHRVLHHCGAAPDQAHLRRQLVLRRVHRGDRHAARGQSPVDPGGLVQVLPGVFRGHRRHGAVVVRAQRRGLFPHHRVPRDDVLLRAETGGSAGVFLSPVDCALLGADHPVHLGRPAPLALHRAAGLGAVAGHGHVADPAGAELGRDDQRHDDSLRRVA
ncbi:hypothetical protein D3C71_1399520 [compost metagenome]